MKKTEREQVIQDRAREKNNNYHKEKIVHRVSRATIFPLIKKSFKIRCSGLENIPAGESCIFAMNHQSILDMLLATAILVPYTNRHLSTFVTQSFFNFLPFNFLLNKWRAIQVHKDNDEKRKKSIIEGIKKLKEGNNILIFPEGIVLGPPSNELLRAHTGVIQLAIKSRKKIVPVGIRGSFHAWKYPQNPSSFYSLFNFNFSQLVELNFGQKIDLCRYYGLNLEEKNEKNKRILRKLVTRLMVKIGQLSSYNYKYDFELL